MGRPWKFALTALILLLGLYLGVKANSFFAISFTPNAWPVEEDGKNRAVPLPLPRLDAIGAIVIPDNPAKSELYARAARALADSIGLRTGTTPQIVASSGAAPPGRTIAIGAHDRNPFTSPAMSPPEDSGSDSFALRTFREDGREVLAVIGATPLGDAYGAYWLAEALRTGARLRGADPFGTDLAISPAASYRLVDQGGIGITPDPAAWNRHDYSMNPRAFEDVFLPRPPYINETAFKTVEEEFKEFIHRTIAMGYNGIVMNGFVEFVNFDRVENGFAVYGKESPFRVRNSVNREKFGRLLRYAHDLGIKVFLATDMLALTDPLADYFKKAFGGIDVSSKAFWDVYKEATEELFTVFPFVDGLMIRVGEAGAAYNIPEWGYWSSLGVKTAPAVRLMLRELLETFEKNHKLLVFRTWSVGVGEIGDMHTNPETYDALLGDIRSPNLIVSTKYCMGDFYSCLPFNPTLHGGRHKRLVEFQARREFEGFGAFPDYVARTYGAGLRWALENKNTEGVWLWTQHGGPLRSSPMSLYPFYGFWLFTDANVHAVSKLAWNPEEDSSSLAREWVMERFGTDPEVVDRMSRMLAMSHAAVEKGLYMSEAARTKIRAFGLEPPPIPWIWDRVSGTSSVLSVAYYLCRKDLEASVREGFEAVRMVDGMRALVSGLDGKLERGKEWSGKIARSLDYEKNLFETLAWYRKLILTYYHWTVTGDGASLGKWRDALGVFDTKMAGHLEKYSGDPDFPAYNFEEAQAAAALFRRNGWVTGAARLLFAFLAGGFVLGGCSALRLLPRDYPGRRGLHLLWSGVFSPWTPPRVPVDRIDIAVLAALVYAALIGGFAVASGFMALRSTLWLALFLTSNLAVSALLCRSLAADSRRGRGELLCGLLSTLSAPALLAAVLVGLAALRGPALPWYLFWMSPAFRIGAPAAAAAAVSWTAIGIFSRCSCSFEMKPWLAGALLPAQAGFALALAGLTVNAFSIERTISTANRELLLIPFAMSDVLGMATQLNIPDWLGISMTCFGLALTLPCAACISRRRGLREPANPAPAALDAGGAPFEETRGPSR
jgi:hypothetical protein